jgi:hypothetical protein
MIQSRGYVVIGMLNPRQAQLYGMVNHPTFSFVATAVFSAWCCTHEALEIMEILDCIVTGYNTIISKFPALINIKVCNGAYMMVGGLRVEDLGSERPEVPLVEFCLGVIKWIQEYNETFKEQEFWERINLVSMFMEVV